MSAIRGNRNRPDFIRRQSLGGGGVVERRGRSQLGDSRIRTDVDGLVGMIDRDGMDGGRGKLAPGGAGIAGKSVIGEVPDNEKTVFRSHVDLPRRVPGDGGAIVVG